LIPFVRVNFNLCPRLSIAAIVPTCTDITNQPTNPHCHSVSCWNTEIRAALSAPSETVAGLATWPVEGCQPRLHIVSIAFYCLQLGTKTLLPIHVMSEHWQTVVIPSKASHVGLFYALPSHSVLYTYKVKVNFVI